MESVQDWESFEQWVIIIKNREVRRRREGEAALKEANLLKDLLLSIETQRLDRANLEQVVLEKETIEKMEKLTINSPNPQ